MLHRTLSITSLLFLLTAALGVALPTFQRTVIVNSGSTPTANGTALLIALANITTNSSTNPWLLKLEPGLFDLGSASLTTKDYVDIEGSGAGVTTITSSQPRSTGNFGAINIAAGVHVGLRELTVQNTSSDAIGIANQSSGFSMDRVNVVIPNGTVSTFGILTGNSNPTITRTTFQLTSANNSAEGIYITNGSPVIKDVTINSQSTSAVAAATGIIITGGGATMDGVVATVSGAQSNYGVQISGGATPLITNSRFTVTTPGSTGGAEGVRVLGSTATLETLRLSVSGGSSSYGIVIDGASFALTTTVRRTVITASGSASLNSGVYVDDGAVAVLLDLDVQVSGGGQAAALFADYANGSINGKVTISDSTLRASGGSTNFGINVSGAGSSIAVVRTSAVASSGTSYGLSEVNSSNTYTLDHSQISGATGSVHLFSAFSAGACELAGPVAPATGTCSASYNGSYAPLSASCL